MSDTKTIAGIIRAPSSHYGNPAYQITFTDDTVARTSANAGFAYAVGNPDMREGCRVFVDFTRSGRISSMRPRLREDPYHYVRRMAAVLAEAIDDGYIGEVLAAEVVETERRLRLYVEPGKAWPR